MVSFDDKTTSGCKINATYNGTLYPDQQKALDSLSFRPVWEVNVASGEVGSEIDVNWLFTGFNPGLYHNVVMMD